MCINEIHGGREQTLEKVKHYTKGAVSIAFPAIKIISHILMHLCRSIGKELFALNVSCSFFLEKERGVRCDKVLPEKNRVIFYEVLHISKPEAFHLVLRAYNIAHCSDRHHQLREVRIALIILITL